MFMSVYTSEFCNENWGTLTVDWHYDEFLDMYNNVMYFSEYKQAINMDHERESARESALAQARN